MVVDRNRHYQSHMSAGEFRRAHRVPVARGAAGQAGVAIVVVVWIEGAPNGRPSPAAVFVSRHSGTRPYPEPCAGTARCPRSGPGYAVVGSVASLRRWVPSWRRCGCRGSRSAGRHVRGGGGAPPGVDREPTPPGSDLARPVGGPSLDQCATRRAPHPLWTPGGRAVRRRGAHGGIPVQRARVLVCRGGSVDTRPHPGSGYEVLRGYRRVLLPPQAGRSRACRGWDQNTRESQNPLRDLGFVVAAVRHENDPCAAPYRCSEDRLRI